MKLILLLKVLLDDRWKRLNGKEATKLLYSLLLKYNTYSSIIMINCFRSHNALGVIMLALDSCQPRRQQQLIIVSLQLVVTMFEVEYLILHNVYIQMQDRRLSINSVTTCKPRRLTLQTQTSFFMPFVWPLYRSARLSLPN